jgi:hypothetical protein
MLPYLKYCIKILGVKFICRLNAIEPKDNFSMRFSGSLSYIVLQKYVGIIE